MSIDVISEIIENFTKNGQQPVTFQPEETQYDEFASAPVLAVTTFQRYRAFEHSDKSEQPLHSTDIELLSEEAALEGLVIKQDAGKFKFEQDRSLEYENKFGDGGFCANG